MLQPIEVYLQPPSPTMNPSCKLPSVKSLFPVSLEDENNSQELPSILLTNHSSDNEEETNREFNIMNSPRLNTIEPHLDISSLATSPYQSSPIMTFSSPSSTTSSMMGSPLISPIQDGPFLLPPPDGNSSRRCRSVSNASNVSSPAASASFGFTFRSLSEPPPLNLPSSEDDEEEGGRVLHPIFGPKRKRGRPPNASKPETRTDNNFTFVKPTVWNVKQNPQGQIQQLQEHQPPQQQQSNTFQTNQNHRHNTPAQFNTENTLMADGINTFTTTNMDMALNIPKKKRGRKPKKQLAGNSCFVWRDLTAPRGANKPKANSDKNNKKEDDRRLLPAAAVNGNNNVEVD